MFEIFSEAYNWFLSYIGTGYPHILFLISLVCLFFIKGEKKEKYLWFCYTGIFVILYICPITAKIIMDYCTGRNVYWRMFWILPIPAFIAYVGTKLIQSKSKTVYKAIMAAAIVCAIVFSGRLVYNNEVFEKTSNWQKLPTSIIHMSDAMLDDWNDGGMIWVVAPQDIVGYFRQYNAQLGMAYNRWNADYKESQYILEQMMQDPIDEEALVQLCNENGYDYLILPAVRADQDALISQKCTVVQEMDGYVIFRLPFWKNH